MTQMMGLGRGLGSLIPKKVPDNIIADKNKEFLSSENIGKILQIPVDAIEANPMQPRQVFHHEDLEALIESIKLYGIIQPLIVTKIANGYQLIAGERRLRSAKIIGLNTVPAIVREAKEQEKLEIAIIENVQRKDLNPIETGLAYERLMNEFNLSQEQVAERLGAKRSSVANTLRFLTLPAKIQEALAGGQITEGHAKVIAGLENEKEQLDFLEKVLKYNYSVRETEKESQQMRPAKINAKKVKDPNLEDKKARLREILNTKVEIKKENGSGQIIIDFYSEEELNYIVKQITK
jgi:ParB family chromosome partitioning protein